MKLENRKLVKVIAEQYARIAELEEQLSMADETIRALSSGKGLPTAKR